jgi:hypothetical protein
MISRLSGTLRIWGRRGQEFWRHRRLLATALTIAATGLAACGGHADDDAEEARSTVAPVAQTQVTNPPEAGRESILIKTRIKGFAGKVLTGSVIGDSPFCPGGTVRHEDGNPDIGFPAVNVFLCPDGQLRIGFGPGPDQMDSAVQTSYWKILEGSGSLAGVSGDGQMTVRFETAGSSEGEETFTGRVVVP